ncbi:galanin receptor type 1-like [Clavelina lepadiformis]|uniref:galanin receptor type 1-like n=1 Tax=Clavelina lepadiformis TaxID=159417 RepID=UPI0040412F42
MVNTTPAQYIFSSVTGSFANSTDGNVQQDNSTGRQFDEGDISPIHTAAILVPVLFTLFFIVGSVGNFMVITVMLKIYYPQPQGLNNSNKFLLNLAISDLFFLIFCVPFEATVYSMDYWPFGAFMCTFTEVCQKISMLASVYTLVALSFDRISAVLYATTYKSKRARTKANWGIAIIWISAAAIGITSWRTRTYFQFRGYNLCIADSGNLYYKGYQMAIFILGYVIPLLIISSCYVGVMYVLRRKAKNSSLANRNSDRGIKHVGRLVTTVVVVFVLLWFPHHLSVIWINFGVYVWSYGTLILQITAHCSAYANSCVNPVIYAFVSQRFRNDFKKVFSCKGINAAVVNAKKCSRNVFSSFRRQMASSFNRQLHVEQERRGSKNDLSEPMVSGSFKKEGKKSKRKPNYDESSTTFIRLTPIMDDKKKKEETSLFKSCGSKPSPSSCHRSTSDKRVSISQDFSPFLVNSLVSDEEDGFGGSHLLQNDESRKEFCRQTVTLTDDRKNRTTYDVAL